MAEPGSTNGLEPAARPPSVDEWAFVDLHCHTSASFDSLASPRTVVETAARRGLTHLAITDHDTIDGAIEAAAAAPAGLTVIVGQEIRTTEGDLIGAFLERLIPRGLSPAEAIAAVREQGGLVGVPHPFDRLRGSLGAAEKPRLGAARAAHAARAAYAAQERLHALLGLVDWIEAWNARVLLGDGNTRASELAHDAGLPGVSVSDAHTTLEIGVASTALSLAAGDPATPAGLLAGLAAKPRLMTGRASLYVRAVTPLARVIQRVRGRGRVRASGAGGRT
ncbi:MAG: PHP domain-containing protein [Chloroflexi bacterium]|nr:PHP domain-containing protein [Chloroflexota bacterium]